MNPLQFKAHPLLFLTVDLFTNSAEHPWLDYLQWLITFATLNLPWSLLLWWSVKKTTEISLSPPMTYAMALPGLILFLPSLLTLLGDLQDGAFLWSERFILVFTTATMSQFLAAFYGGLLGYPRSGKSIGLAAGMAISLTLLLGAIPYGALLLTLDGWLGIF